MNIEGLLGFYHLRISLSQRPVLIIERWRQLPVENCHLFGAHVRSPFSLLVTRHHKTSSLTLSVLHLELSSRPPRPVTRPNKNHLHGRQGHRGREDLHAFGRGEEGQTAGEDGAEKHDKRQTDDRTGDIVEREDGGGREEGCEHQGDDFGDARRVGCFVYCGV